MFNKYLLQDILTSLLSVFWCQHTDTTFPITTKTRGTYVVCLLCGCEFSYDWKDKKRGSKIVTSCTSR